MTVETTEAVETNESAEAKPKKQMNLFSPTLKKHLAERNFAYSNFHSTSGFVYTLGRTVTPPSNTSDEALEAAATRMGENLVVAANGVEKEGVQIEFKVMDTKVNHRTDGKVDLLARIKPVNYNGGRKARVAAPKPVPFVPEFDLEGNIINAPIDTTSEVSSEAVNDNVTAKRSK